MGLRGNITDIQGIRVGHATDPIALTGCTVVLAEGGAVGGVDVRGFAPGTRETALLKPSFLVRQVHAVLLSGGSAYGLDAAAGVMRYLEERGAGFRVGPVVVPIVPAAVVFDLMVGDPMVRPGPEMGYRACLDASAGDLPAGNVGAGTGATVGKIFGPEYCMKGGVGNWSGAIDGGPTVGVLAVVNPFGDVRDPSTGRILAGALNPMTGVPADTAEMMRRGRELGDMGALNTTLVVVATDARLDKEGVNAVAQMAQDGISRAISPAHTLVDGDVVFALATGARPADITAVGSLAAEGVARAIAAAVLAAETAGGVLSAADLESRGGAGDGPPAAG